MSDKVDRVDDTAVREAAQAWLAELTGEPSNRFFVGRPQARHMAAYVARYIVRGQTPLQVHAAAEATKVVR